MSVDGKIAARDGSSKMSSDEDWKAVHELRAQVDAILVGLGTVLVDDPLLTNRSGSGGNPTRVVVDSRARIPLQSKIVRSATQYSLIVATSRSADQTAIRELEQSGAKVIVVSDQSKQPGATNEEVDLERLLEILFDGEKIKKLLLEGGSRLNWSMISQGLVDEIRITISPIILGGSGAKSLVGGEGFEKISEALSLELVDVTTRKSTGETILRYRVNTARAKAKNNRGG